jgi:hypothetical protein
MPPPEPLGVGAPTDGAGTPWERRRELGTFEAWKQTVWMALFEPGKLFREARLDKGSDQLWFALITGSIFVAAGQILDRLLFASQREQAMQLINDLRRVDAPMPAWLQTMLSRTTEQASIGATIAVALLAPLVMYVFIYANAGITHAAALVTGQARRGFAATFAAVAYGMAPCVLLIVPGCGGIASFFWCIVLIGVGLKITHGISSGGAAWAVLAPYLLLCCGGCLVLVTAAAMFGGQMGAAP